MDISKLVDAFLTGVNLDGLVKISSILLKCPILILDDAFHVISYYKSEGFQDIPFDSTIESKNITYEVVRNLNWQPNLKKPVFLTIEESPWRRRVSTLRAEHKNIGYLFCVDAEDHLEQVSDDDMNKIEMILAKQYLAQIENQFLSKNTEEEILTHLLDGDYQNPALFKLQITNTWLEQMDQGHLVLIDVSNRTNLQMSYRSLDAKLETTLAESRPFLYQKNVLLFVHKKRQVEILENIAKEFQVFVVISSVIKDIYELPKIYKQILEVTSLLQNKTFSAKVFYTEGYRLRMMLDQVKSRFDLVPDVYKRMYEYDKENHTVYCETLYYYELKNHSVIETAQELFTHRNTVVYRLRKIKDMFHIDDAHESEKLIRLISLGLCLIKMNQDDIVLDNMHASDIFGK
ncbi:MAG: helix-turn-helix domain-containing protein [Erysipelotrichaceae bacterium]|nr:helix-turn-helix domain-containing protein [Erysipelotrichaceae bacterium]MDY6034273.1 helix-turn-helix domain-containing protein [Bulleidia sp.]